jgi:hypothetical protein
MWSHNALFKNGAKPCALLHGISSRSRISRRVICSSVCLITTGATKNPRKIAPPGNPALKSVSAVSRVSSKQTKKMFGSNRNSTCFGSFSVCFVKPINYFFGLFRFVLVFRIHFETTETNRTVSKQNRKTEKIVEKGVKASKIVFQIQYDHYVY